MAVEREAQAHDVGLEEEKEPRKPERDQILDRSLTRARISLDSDIRGDA